MTHRPRSSVVRTRDSKSLRRGFESHRGHQLEIQMDDSRYSRPLPNPRSTGEYVPQVSNGEMTDLISRNLPHLDPDEVRSIVWDEQLRQRLWNGYGQ